MTTTEVCVLHPLFSSSLVMLIVGGPQSPAHELHATTLYVHEELLIAASPVFSRMLSTSYNKILSDGTSSPWIEAKTRQVILPEDRVEDWARLVYWLYADRLAGNTLQTRHLQNKTNSQVLFFMQKHQPGLADWSLITSIKAYQRWKHHNSQSRNQYGCLDDAKLSVVLRKALSKAGIDRQITKDDLALVRALNVGEQFNPAALRCSRPDPPMFGPLIRLAVLADKYGIGTTGQFGLQRQIALRLQAVNSLANAIPNREDVNRMWHGLPEYNHPVKLVVLDCYARLKEQSFKNVVGCSRVEIVVKTTEPSLWPAEFLRDVLKGAGQA